MFDYIIESIVNEKNIFDIKMQKLCQEFDLDIVFYVDENARFTSETQYDNFMLSRGSLVLEHFPLNKRYSIEKKLESKSFQDKLFFSKIKYQDVELFIEKYLQYLEDKLFEEFLLKCCIFNQRYCCERNC